MPTAKEGDVSIVQIESEGYNKAKVVTPIVAMKAGADYQQYVDVLIPDNATFKLIQGEGPVSLIGSHCVDFYGYKDVGANYSDDDESMDTEDEDENKKKSSKESPSKDKKASPAKDGDKKESPTKEGDKKASPAKEEDKKASPTKDGGKTAEKERELSGGKKRKASEEKSKSAEK